MTEEEEKRVERLRKNGNSYRRIAEITGLSSGTVKMYCYRKQIHPKSDDNRDVCIECGNRLDRKKSGRPALFCSTRCRVYYWRRQSQMVKDHERICPYCGKTFFTYEKTRKFCSHPCYIASRFGGAADGTH